jgi:ribosome biogenesis GTPase
MAEPDPKPAPTPDPKRPARRAGGKARPSDVRAELRKNKADRARDKNWSRKWLEAAREGRDEELEESGEGERITGRTGIGQKKVYVAPVARADKAAVEGRREILAGQVVRIRGTNVFVWHGGRELPCSIRGALKSFDTPDRKVVVVGDKVRWSLLPGVTPGTGEPEGVIEAVEPRTTVLSRADSKRSDRRHIVAANVDQLAIVAAMREPDLRHRLIDRYLVSAAKGGLEPLICLGKADLAEPDELDDWLTLYRGLGYRILAVSAKTGLGVDELRAALHGRTSVIAGQSGVGKSSLLNAVQPGLNLRTGDISDFTGKGTHTTTEVTLLPLKDAEGRAAGAVVDTPGIRSFGLWNLSPKELEAHFAEIAPLVADCKFADCTHRHETGCAVIAAVEAGRISEARYDSYLTLYESLETGRPDPRD